MCLSPGGLGGKIFGGGGRTQCSRSGLQGAARIGWDELVSVAGPTPRRADYSLLGAQVLSHGS